MQDKVLEIINKYKPASSVETAYDAATLHGLIPKIEYTNLADIFSTQLPNRNEEGFKKLFRNWYIKKTVLNQDTLLDDTHATPTNLMLMDLYEFLGFDEKEKHKEIKKNVKDAVDASGLKEPETYPQNLLIQGLKKVKITELNQFMDILKHLAPKEISLVLKYIKIEDSLLNSLPTIFNDYFLVTLNRLGEEKASSFLENIQIFVKKYNIKQETTDNFVLYSENSHAIHVLIQDVVPKNFIDLDAEGDCLIGILTRAGKLNAIKEIFNLLQEKGKDPFHAIFMALIQKQMLLFDAIEASCNSLQLFKFFLSTAEQHGLNQKDILSCRSSSYRNLMHAIAEQNNDEVMNHLAQIKAFPMNEYALEADEYNCTPVHEAVTNKNFKMAHKILQIIPAEKRIETINSETDQGKSVCDLIGLHKLSNLNAITFKNQIKYILTHNGEMRKTNKLRVANFFCSGSDEPDILGPRTTKQRQWGECDDLYFINNDGPVLSPKKRF